MKAIGTIKITEELTLTNPSMEVENITYSWSGDNKVRFELIFIEEGGTLRNSRTFEFVNKGGGYMSGDDAWNMISTHKTLKQFNVPTEENITWITRFKSFFNIK